MSQTTLSQRIAAFESRDSVIYMRECGEKALSTVISRERNVKILERYIHRHTLSELTKDSDKDFNTYTTDEGDTTLAAYMKKYRRYTYQMVGDVTKKRSLKDVLNSTKFGAMGWDHEQYRDLQLKLEEYDDFIINPFEVEEGVTECRCGSKRVFTYQKQTRGADEPMTTFAKCMACNAQWTYSG